MNEYFMEMYGKSEPPQDFEQRIKAPRIFVAAVEISEIEARNELPFNRNPLSGGVGTISGRPDYAEGVNRANENAFNLVKVRDSMRKQFPAIPTSAPSSTSRSPTTSSASPSIPSAPPNPSR